MPNILKHGGLHRKDKRRGSTVYSLRTDTFMPRGVATTPTAARREATAAERADRKAKSKRGRVAPIDQIITASLINAGLVTDVGYASRYGVPVMWRGDEPWYSYDDPFGLPQFDSPTYDVDTRYASPDSTFQHVVEANDPGSYFLRNYLREEWVAGVVEQQRRWAVATLDEVRNDLDTEWTKVHDMAYAINTTHYTVHTAWIRELAPPLSSIRRWYMDAITETEPLPIRPKTAADTDNGACLFLASVIDEGDDEVDEVVVHDDGLAPIRPVGSWRQHLVTHHGLEPQPDDDGTREAARVRSSWHMAKRFAMTECLSECEGRW